MTNPTVSYSVKHIDGRAVVVKRDRAEDVERGAAHTSNADIGTSEWVPGLGARKAHELFTTLLNG